LTADSLFDKLLDFLEYFACKDYYRCGSISYFGVLGARNVGEDSSGGVDNVKQLQKYC
jgi:hypothetical protein